MLKLAGLHTESWRTISFKGNVKTSGFVAKTQCFENYSCNCLSN